MQVRQQGPPHSRLHDCWHLTPSLAAWGCPLQAHTGAGTWVFGAQGAWTATARTPQATPPAPAPARPGPGPTHQCSNFSGVTNSATGRWCGVGCRYCPSVRMSTPASRRSYMVSMTSSSVSPAGSRGVWGRAGPGQAGGFDHRPAAPGGARQGERLCLRSTATTAKCLVLCRQATSASSKSRGTAAEPAGHHARLGGQGAAATLPPKSARRPLTQAQHDGRLGVHAAALGSAQHLEALDVAGPGVAHPLLQAVYLQGFRACVCSVCVCGGGILGVFGATRREDGWTRARLKGSMGGRAAGC